MEVNLFAVFVAAIGAIAVGMLWYSKPMFGPMWMQLLGWDKKEEEDAKKSAMTAMIAGMAVQLVTAYVLAHILYVLDVDSASEAIKAALTLWVGLVGPTQIGSVLWEKRPFTLFVLNGAHSIVALCVMSIILTLVS